MHSETRILTVWKKILQQKTESATNKRERPVGKSDEEKETKFISIHNAEGRVVVLKRDRLAQM